ncbi:MAG: type II secretion system F family protein [Clostridium sp.]
MPVFLYEAKSIDGTTIKNKMDAQAKEEVIASLRQRGYYPIAVKEEGTGMNADIEIDMLNKVKLKDLSMFCRQFAFILQSGTPMLKALELAAEQCDSKKLKDILNRSYKKVEKGRSLSEALKHEDDIPELMVNMIEAGEASGKLEKIMGELADYYKKVYKQQQKISSATMYPKIVIGFSTIVVLALVAFVVPSFVQTLNEVGGELPLPTKLLIWISDMLTSYWIIWLAIAAVVIGFNKLVLSKDEKVIETRAKNSLKGKVFGVINRQLLAGRFANTFAVLSSSGVGIIQALEITARILENKYVEKKLDIAIKDIKKGNPIGKTIEDLNVFPRMLTQMVTLGEETGQLEEMLIKTSEFYDGEVEVAIEKMIAAIEPIFIMVLGGVVLFIILSLMLPMFSIMNAIQ